MKSYRDIASIAKQTDSYWIERAKMGLAIQLSELMKQRSIGVKELADKLQITEVYCQAALRGEVVITVDLAVRMARALDHDLEIGFRPIPTLV